MRKTAALPDAPPAGLRQADSGGPRRRTGGKSRRVCRDDRPAQGPNPPGALVWCIHCYQVLGEAQTRQERIGLESAHFCQEKQLARQPESPPPFH
jgi:hypothetical protein